MVVEEATIADGCTKGDVASPPARNLYYGTVTNEVASPFAPFCQVEPFLVNEDVLLWVSHGIQLKDSLQKSKNIHFTVLQIQ